MINEQGYTALHSNFLQTGSPMNRAMTIQICKAGANAHAKESFGRTPLHISAGVSNYVMLEVMLRYGDASPSGNVGDTSLHLAIRWQGKESVSLLLRAGANVRLRNGQGFMPSQVKHDCEARICVIQSPFETFGTVKGTEYLPLNRERDYKYHVWFRKSLEKQPCNIR